MKLRNLFHTPRGRDLLRWFPIVGRNRHYQRYIIFSMARSGSTLLALRLNSHPQVEGLTEIFNTDSLAWHSARWWQPTALRQRRFARLADMKCNDPNDYARHMAWGPMMSDVRAAGFKMLWHQFLAQTPQQREEILAVPDLKVILLERHDALGQYVSQMAATQFGVHHAPIGGRKPIAPAIPIDPANFAEFVRQRRLSTVIIRQATRHLPRLSISYEDLVAFPARENARLCEFLGIDNIALKDQLQKVSSTSLADRVDNIDDLIAALRGTDLEPYLLAAGIR